MLITNSPNKKFLYYSYAVLGYVIAVIAWGAYVRATGSGAGCGRHWPLCNGVVIPRSPELATIIEFSHRITSGISLVFTGFLVVWAYRLFASGTIVRFAATLSAIFLILEAAFGAGLVLLQLVANDASVLRAIVIALHLVNTFFLIGCLTMTSWSAKVGVSNTSDFHLNRDALLFVVALLLFLLVGASGAIVALGDTLFPSSSFVEGWNQDFSPSAHFLIRLRVVHPALAVALAMYLLFLASRYQAMATLGVSVLVQLVVGAVTVLRAAPVELQLLHLVLADITWILLVLTALKVLLMPSSSTFSTGYSTEK